MQKLRDHYDWIVLGDHPGALLSGALAARLGLSVLMLPMQPSMGVILSRSGQFLDPQPNYLLGLGRVDRWSGLLSDALSRLGMAPSEAEAIQGKDSFPQIITPHARLSFTPNEEAFGIELQRELGKDCVQKLGLSPALRHAEQEYLSFWLQLPDRLTLRGDKPKRATEEVTDLNYLVKKLRQKAATSQQAWFSAGNTIAALEREIGSSKLDEIFNGLWYSVSGAIGQDPKLQDIMHAIVLTRTGAGFRGGIAAYREFAIGLAKRLGAHLPEHAECRRIFVDNGRFVGVQIANRGNMISAGAGILGCGLSQASERVSESGRNWFKRMKKSPKPNGWRFTVALTVHEEAVPPGLGRRTIWQEKGAPVLEVEVADPADYGQREAHHKLVFARTVMPYTQESLTIEYQRLMGARILRQLAELIPYLEYHIVRIFPDFRTASGSPQAAIAGADESPAIDPSESKDELTRIYGFTLPEMIPENLRCFGKEGGVGSRSGVEGLFVASDESFPELGSLGGTVAALESAAWLAHRSGLAGPFV